MRIIDSKFMELHLYTPYRKELGASHVVSRSLTFSSFVAVSNSTITRNKFIQLDMKLLGFGFSISLKWRGK